MSYFDEELITDLKKLNIDFSVISQAEQDSMVSRINERIPFSGNQIDWSRLESFGSASSILAISLIAAEICKISDNDLVIISDSACDNAYSISPEHLNQVLKILSDLPQHTYIVSEDFTWIACISFEGRLDFCKFFSEPKLNKP
ncbi:hypothetical protein [Pseudomonas sp. L1(2025)]|uniref:hypothetical protein n=1 Tax=Pseudomonas sp. L1(2025) TaxID=3449429 RepID=UPI003F690922